MSRGHRKLAITFGAEPPHWSIGKMVLAQLYPMILGLERIETIRLFRQNEGFQSTIACPATPIPPPFAGFWSVQPLAFVRRPDGYGTADQAAHRGLRPERPPHPSPLRQRNLLQSAPADAQSRELFQAILFASRLTRRHAANPPSQNLVMPAQWPHADNRPSLALSARGPREAVWR